MSGDRDYLDEEALSALLPPGVEPPRPEQRVGPRDYLEDPDAAEVPLHAAASQLQPVAPTSMRDAPVGMYPDPLLPGGLRRWSGTRWTNITDPPGGPRLPGLERRPRRHRGEGLRSWRGFLLLVLLGLITLLLFKELTSFAFEYGDRLQQEGATALRVPQVDVASLASSA